MRNKTIQNEHGTTRSYVVGFILSLVFTLIPYHLVVNKIISGNALLAAILGFAVIQMFIQIFFFLHLGRGPKPLYNVVFFGATAGLIILVIAASLLIMSNLYRNMSPQEFVRRLAQKENISQINGADTGACSEHKENHIVTIKESLVTPLQVQAERCDTLTFINEDAMEREIVFGVHPAQESYGGEFEVPLESGEPETITLNQTGSFVFHDHHEPGVSGQFRVAP